MQQSVTVYTLAYGFNQPRHINVDNDFNVYATDYASGKIRKISPNGLIISDVAGTGAASSVNGPASSASFFYPWGMLVKC